MEDIARIVKKTYPQCEFKHIREYQKQGVSDENWVPEIAKDESWIIISADRSKQNKSKASKYYKGEKLRVVCKKHNVTLVELSQKIHHLPNIEKIAAILYVWEDLMNVPQAPRGSRHLIKFKGSARGKTVITQVDPPPPKLEKSN